MDNTTQKFFNAYLKTVAKAYGIHPSIVQQAKAFAATPSVEQSLKKALLASSNFLSKINLRTRKNITGDKIGLNVNASLATTVDTKGGGVRTPKSVHSLSNDPYVCKKVNFDTAISYEDLDEWAEFPEFKKQVQELITQTIINNRIQIGWYGEGWVKDSDIDANPLMQDVNIGWFQKARDNAPAQVLTNGAVAGTIKIGAGGDFLNIDHAVETIKTGIPVHKRNDPNLRVLVGSDILAQQRIALYAALGEKPTEKERIETDKVLETFGGIPRADEPYFPGRAIVITSLKNLGLYTQKGSMRRQIVDNSSKDQIENYTSMYDAYVIEDYESFVAVDFKNVKLPDGAGGWA